MCGDLGCNAQEVGKQCVASGEIMIHAMSRGMLPIKARLETDQLKSSREEEKHTSIKTSLKTMYHA
jgi:hypothetical protein